MSRRFGSRLGRPSPALILAFVALLVALSGTAYAATTIVNIADPANAAHMAKVDANGRLAVGDTNGPLTVDGTVTANAQAAPASAFYHQATFGLVSEAGCKTIATAPAGKALIVRQIRIDVFSDPTPGESQLVRVWAGTGCSGAVVADVNPGTVGQTDVPFDPGLGVAAGGALSATTLGSVRAESFVDGFTVAPSAVPSTGAGVAAGAAHGSEQQR